MAERSVNGAEKRYINAGEEMHCAGCLKDMQQGHPYHTINHEAVPLLMRGRPICVECASPYLSPSEPPETKSKLTFYYERIVKGKISAANGCSDYYISQVRKLAHPSDFAYDKIWALAGFYGDAETLFREAHNVLSSAGMQARAADCINNGAKRFESMLESFDRVLERMEPKMDQGTAEKLGLEKAMRNFAKIAFEMYEQAATDYYTAGSGWAAYGDLALSRACIHLQRIAGAGVTSGFVEGVAKLVEAQRGIDEHTEQGDEALRSFMGMVLREFVSKYPKIGAGHNDHGIDYEYNPDVPHNEYYAMGDMLKAAGMPEEAGSCYLESAKMKTHRGINLMADMLVNGGKTKDHSVQTAYEAKKVLADALRLWETLEYTGPHARLRMIDACNAYILKAGQLIHNTTEGNRVRLLDDEELALLRQ